MRTRYQALAVLVAIALSVALVGCHRASDTTEAVQGASPAAAFGGGHLQTRGTWFYRPDGTRFEWRGLTAFRLLELLASGKTAEADALLAWAAEHRITVVRVLAMAQLLFQLPPQVGRPHLDSLFERAARRGLYVEIVALADTASYDQALERLVTEVGTIAAAHPNALVEIANEPYHGTQSPAVQDLASLRRLLPLVPEHVPVVLGAGERPVEYADGDYVTGHLSRSGGAARWGHVRDLIEARRILEAVKKPFVHDEPIGAGPHFQHGRRDDDPERFRAAALLSRMMGVATTFHYEGGLHAKIPEGRERECFDAWLEAWTLMPDDIETSGSFREAGVEGAATTLKRASGEWVGGWEVQRGNDVWVLVAGAGSAEIEWAPGWQQTGEHRWVASRLVRATKR